MAQTRYCFFILAIALVLTLDANEQGVDASICCREHPEIGKCIKGVDDGPDGKCRKFCNRECRGVFFKLLGRHHKCIVDQ
ncbi:putative defensin-like protein 20 [Rutidosis leptorrhynchoides]|uniref:putative defensin-like protein 20 n=1 Tax=Rutidosis leptorrhynchoides TaxID=125765 RepID=UPI003A9A5D0B